MLHRGASSTAASQFPIATAPLRLNPAWPARRIADPPRPEVVTWTSFGLEGRSRASEVVSWASHH